MSSSKNHPTSAAASVRVVERTLAAHRVTTTRLAVVPGGHGGINLRAEGPAGPLAIKLRDDPRPLAVVRSVSALLAGRGIPHPEVVVPPTLTQAGWLTALRWIPGEALVDATLRLWSEADAARLGADLGSWLSQLHGVRPPHQPWLPRAERRYEEKLHRCVDRHLIDVDLAAAVARFWDALRPALADAPVSLIHRDLQPGNIVVHRRALAGVIDFEQARLADPLYDLVKLKEWVFPWHPAIEPALVGSYGLDDGDPRVRSRLAAVSVLEFLSALVYFDRQADPAMVVDQRARLRDLVTAAEGAR